MNSSLQNADLSSLERSEKPKLLVVDDEQDNLDLLYRTFRRDFQVFKAESGVHALNVLEKQGEVAVIISDQRMPEMKGTEFLRRTVPQFPDTIRIVLTGFTDVEDLVEAINSGQVYKYITKPWDPEELKAVVKKASETYDLLKFRSEQLRQSQAHNALMTTIIEISQKSSTPEECLLPFADAFGENFQADACIVQIVARGALIDAKGVYGDMAGDAGWLEQDPLTQKAIATQKLQVCPDVSADSSLADLEPYKTGEICVHMVIPMTYRQEVLAVVSLQWQQSYQLTPEEATLIQQCTDEAAIALTCVRYYRPT